MLLSKSTTNRVRFRAIQQCFGAACIVLAAATAAHAGGFTSLQIFSSEQGELIRYKGDASCDAPSCGEDLIFAIISPITKYEISLDVAEIDGCLGSGTELTGSDLSALTAELASRGVYHPRDEDIHAWVVSGCDLCVNPSNPILCTTNADCPEGIECFDGTCGELSSFSLGFTPLANDGCSEFCEPVSLPEIQGDSIFVVTTVEALGGAAPLTDCMAGTPPLPPRSIDSPIPTLSSWGFVILTLLLVAGARVRFGLQTVTPCKSR